MAHIFDTTTNVFVDCDTAPINSNAPVTTDNGEPVAIAYNSALWTYSTGTGIYSSGGFYLFCIWNVQPTYVKDHNNNSLLSYVKYDSNSGLYYMRFSIGSGGTFIGSVTNSSVEVFTTDTRTMPQEYKDYIGILQITYTWHSLQSLTGNGQTVQLVTLNSNAINDGEPVSNADLSSFTVLPSNQNNVRYLVNLAVAAAASESTNDVTIIYTIPALKKGTYTTVKLYGKIGEYPACDNTDDLIEDLDPTKTTKDILGLTGNSTYYFCIQFITSDGLKLSSNVESIFIDEIPIPEDIRPYLDIINGTGFFWKNYSDEYDLGGGYKQKADVYPYENYTYCAVPSDANNKINVASIIVDSNDAVCVAGNIYSIYITSNQDVYSVDISFIKLESVAHNMWNGATWNGIYFYSSTDRFDGRGFSYISSLPVTGSFSGTLAGIGAWIAARFRNVNIFI